jgi:ATPase subunit of ABC transporter with duplicated ATPase domains
MPATLIARQIGLAHGARTILDRVDLLVAPGDRVGVVGPNGTGKTTLLRILAGLTPPDAGTVTLTPPDATVGYLPQEPDRLPDEDVTGLLLRRTGLAAATAELDAATAALAEDAEGPGVADRYSQALDRWMALGGADFEARAEETWADLGMPAHLLGQQTTTLSGGQAARAQLASILLSRFDVILLDEPTNDLDFDGLERLEGFVAARTEPLVVVSHDRAFLERTITDVLEIDEHSHRASRYAGGWLAFQEERRVARRHAEEAYAGFAETRKDLTERIRRQRQWSDIGVKKTTKNPKDNDKAQRGFFVNRTEKQASKVRASEKALSRLETVDKPWEGWELRLTIAAAPRAGAVTARLSGAVVERGAFRLGPVDVEVGWGERVAILGPNGAGKSTFLAALLGRIPLAGGTQWMGPGVVVGEIDQHRAMLRADVPLLAAFQAASGMQIGSETRQLLAKFGLGAGHIDRPVTSLSPGERTRATLALLMARGVNCLVLDEPTNHLDLPAIEQIEQALETFEGTLLLVTHDRALLDNVRIDRVLLVGKGNVTEGQSPALPDPR